MNRKTINEKDPVRLKECYRFAKTIHIVENPPEYIIPYVNENIPNCNIKTNEKGS